MNDRSYSVLQAIAMAWDIRRGNWQEDELRLLPHLVRPGETAIDIGANFGLYAYHLSNLLGPQGRVVCFEPVPFTAMTFRLVGRLLRFRGVELVNKGCGEEAGRVTFTLPVSNTGAISAGLSHFAGRRDDRPGRERHAQFDEKLTRDIECEVTTLDTFLPDLKDVSVLKSDIEGADLLALRGARETLERHHPTIITEVNTWFLEGFGLKLADMYEYLGGLGYTAYSFKGGRLVDASHEDAARGTNWIWVHPSRRDRLSSLLPGQA